MKPRPKNELVHCATTVYPNYNYEQKLAVGGIYRPPGEKQECPPYGDALSQILRAEREQQTIALVAGDSDINTWMKEYQN